MAESYTRRAKEQKYYSKDEPHPYRGYIWAAFLVLGSAVAMFSKSSISLLAGHIYVTNGIAAYGMLFAALSWAIVEIFTEPAKDWVDFIVRVVPTFILGAIFGGIAGYITQFGPLVQLPAMGGNALALLLEAGMLYLTSAIALTAAYYHDKGVKA